MGPVTILEQLTVLMEIQPMFVHAMSVSPAITVQKTLMNVIPILVKIVATVLISCMGLMSVSIPANFLGRGVKVTPTHVLHPSHAVMKRNVLEVCTTATVCALLSVHSSRSVITQQDTVNHVS
jgi:hypothetical protein